MQGHLLTTSSGGGSSVVVSRDRLPLPKMIGPPDKPSAIGLVRCCLLPNEVLRLRDVLGMR